MDMEYISLKWWHLYHSVFRSQCVPVFLSLCLKTVETLMALIARLSEARNVMQGLVQKLKSIWNLAFNFT